jgi:prepilin-type N-terminal cleavage/methylation domain-containing protein
MIHRAFTILEVILALSIVALLLAVLTPALIGTLKAEKQARRILEPLATVQIALQQFRTDLWATPKPNGSLCSAFSLSSCVVSGRQGASVTATIRSPPPLHPHLAVSAPDVGQATVTWSVQDSADGLGLSWIRTVQANLLATGATPKSTPEVLLDHLASLSIETLVNGTFCDNYDSDDQAGTLPILIRVKYRLLDEDGNTGPLQVQAFDLPLGGS